MRFLACRPFRYVPVAMIAVLFALPDQVLASGPTAPSGSSILNSERIATSALSVAQSTRTTGRCYAAVSRALHPIGINLYGSAAYEARDILQKDDRFLPLSIYNVDELRRGDIIVYTRSNSHPYGHISVYEGNLEEASDHVSAVTHTQAYGSATVFRLRNETMPELASASAPFPAPYMPQSSSQPGIYANESRMERAVRMSNPDNISPTLSTVRRGYKLLTGETIERTVLRRCSNYLFKR